MEGTKRSKWSSKTSAEIIAGNDVLLTESILLRLPVKLLVRFRLVCKHWRYLIFSPSFCRLYTRHHHLIQSGGGGGGPFIFSPTESAGVIYYNPIVKSLHKVPLINDVDHPYASSKILQSCNGLWLIELDGGKNYSVYNPTTKRSRVLKMARQHGDIPYRRRQICLGFDPSRSVYYRVFFIYLLQEEEFTLFCVDAYDSETEEWTSIYPSKEYGLSELHGWTYWNNKLYSLEISAFLDLQTGKFGSVPTIEDPLITGSIWYPRFYHFTDTNGHVRCAVTVDEYVRPISTRYLLLYELMEDNSGWLQLYKANLNGIVDVWNPKLIGPVLEYLPKNTNSEIPKNMNRQLRVLGTMSCADQTNELHVLVQVDGMVISYRFCDGVLDLKAFGETYQQVLMQHYPTHNHKTTTAVAPLFAPSQIFTFVESLAPV